MKNQPAFHQAGFSSVTSYPLLHLGICNRLRIGVCPEAIHLVDAELLHLLDQFGLLVREIAVVFGQMILGIACRK